MTQANLGKLTVEQLVSRFTEIGIAEDKAEDDNAEYTRLFFLMDSIEEKLKSRPNDQRRALMALYEHRNMHVRLMAAKATLAVAPQEARKLIESIANSRHFPQAGDAGMCLLMLDRGEFVPD